MSETATSVNGVAIALTDERWEHIQSGHPEMAGRRRQVLSAIASPARVLEGSNGELMAVKRSGRRGWLVVVYRESADSGFVITSFRTTRTRSLDRRKQLWP